MISIDYSTLNSGTFNQAFTKLSESVFKDIRTTWKMSRLTKNLSRALAEARKTYLAWASEYFEKDEKGHFVKSEIENSPIPYKVIEAREEEFLKKLGEFLAEKVDVKGDMITVTELDQVPLTPMEMIALEPIVDQASFCPPESPQLEIPLEA